MGTTKRLTSFLLLFLSIHFSGAGQRYASVHFRTAGSARGYGGVRYAAGYGHSRGYAGVRAYGGGYYGHAYVAAPRPYGGGYYGYSGLSVGLSFGFGSYGYPQAYPMADPSPYGNGYPAPTVINNYYYGAIPPPADLYDEPEDPYFYFDEPADPFDDNSFTPPSSRNSVMPPIYDNGNYGDNDSRNHTNNNPAGTVPKTVPANIPNNYGPDIGLSNRPGTNLESTESANPSTAGPATGNSGSGPNSEFMAEPSGKKVWVKGHWKYANDGWTYVEGYYKNK